MTNSGAIVDGGLEVRSSRMIAVAGNSRLAGCVVFGRLKAHCGYCSIVDSLSRAIAAAAAAGRPA
jgi:hypothetical protein